MTGEPLPGRAEEIEPFWLAYQRACAVQVEGFSATAFGHSRALADELAAAVNQACWQPERQAYADLWLDGPAGNNALATGAGPRASVDRARVGPSRNVHPHTSNDPSNSLG